MPVAERSRKADGLTVRKGYYRIAEDLRQEIMSGNLKANMPIVTERKLAEIYNVNHSTARKATQLLAEEGLLEKRQGAGVFVKAGPKAETRKIGLCVPTLTISEYSDMVEIVEDILFESGIQFVLLRRDKEKSRTAKLQIIRKYLNIAPLDAILFASSPTREEINMLKKHYPEVKVAVIENDLSDYGIDSFYSDYETGAFFATEHLCKQGAKTVLHITGPSGSPSESRLHGYERAMRNWNLEPRIVTAENFLEQGGFDAMKSQIDSNRIPDAVFAVNDLCAIGAIKALGYSGIKVPDNVKVIGMGNLREGIQHRPPISTVDTKVNEMVKMAIKRLIERLSGNTAEEMVSCMIPPHLIIRKSSRNSRINIKDIDN